jgi:hypothetical protein
MSRSFKVAARVGVAVSVGLGIAILAAPAGAEPGFTSVQPMPDPVASSHPPIAPWGSVSCPTTTSCTAVGAFGSYGTGEGHPSYVTETSGVWGTPKAVPVPLGGAYSNGTDSAQLDQVSCLDATDCTAVGSYPSASGKSQFAMAATETSGVWGAAAQGAIPANAHVGDTYSGLGAVSCIAVGTCTAVGVYAGNDQSYHDYAITQSSGAWQTPVELPDIPNLSAFQFALPDSISCRDATDCTAIGYGFSPAGLALTTYAWTETAGTWGTPVVLYGTDGFQAFLGQSIACPTATTCLVVGAFGGLANLKPAVAVETSGVWANSRTLPVPRLSPITLGGLLSGISCGSPTTCEAVGLFSTKKNGSYGAAGAVTWSSGTWSSAGLVRGIRAGKVPSDDSSFTAVSCPSDTSCTGIGGGGILPYKGGNEPVYPFSAALTPVRSMSSPQPPTALTSTPIGGGVILSWHPPVDDGGAPVIHFTAAVGPRPQCTTAGRRCAFHGLVNGHRYVAGVSDTTSFGGSRSTVVFVTAGARPAVVTHVHAASGPSLLAISWARATTPPGEPVLRYVVRVGPGGRSCVTRALSCRVGGLTSHDIYSVTVTAIDANGAGPTSRPIRAAVG